jgi:hypothetical protein
MKKIIFALVLIFVLLPTLSFAQLQIKIGNDTTFCGSTSLNYEDSQLGANLTITGGIPPYQYVWSAEIRPYEPYLDWTFYASDFLDDTTISTPIFKNCWLDQSWQTFTLTVTDAENNMATDAINVRFSSFVLFMGYFVLRPNIGDEILLSFMPIGGGIEPYRSYSWSPPDDLLTPNEQTTICRVSQSAFYFITVEDSVGCRATNLAYEIIVQPTNIIEAESVHNNIPFIINGALFWKNTDNLPVKLNLYALNGAKIKSIYPITNEYCLKTNVSVPVIYEIIIGNKRYTGKYINF